MSQIIPENREDATDIAKQEIKRVEESTASTDDGYNDNYWIKVESNRRKVSAHINLKYRKTNDQITERIFDIESFSRGEEGYHIHGYCHRKKRDIALSSLGIIDPVDIDTGEAIADIKRYLEEKYLATADYNHDLLFDKYGWAIYCLVYLSATSGSILKKERDIISAFIKSLEGFSNLDVGWIEMTIKNLYRPGKMEIRKWAKTAKEQGANLNLISPAINQLSANQTPENSEFKSFVNYLFGLSQPQTAAISSQNVDELPEADKDDALFGLNNLINLSEDKARFDDISNESYKSEALRILGSQAPDWYDHSKGHTFWGYLYADYAKALGSLIDSLNSEQRSICDYFASLAITDGTISANTIAEMAKVKGLIADARGEIEKSMALLDLARKANPKIAVKKKLAELEKKLANKKEG